MEDNLKKNIKKMEDDLKKNENGRRSFFCLFKNQNDDLKKQWKKTSTKKKMENDLKGKKWKTTSKKMEDEPINLIGSDTIVNSPSII